MITYVLICRLESISKLICFLFRLCLNIEVNGANKNGTTTKIDSKPQDLEAIRFTIQRWNPGSSDLRINKHADSSFAMENVVENIARVVQMVSGHRVTNLGFGQSQNTWMIGLKVLVNGIKIGIKTTGITKMKSG